MAKSLKIQIRTFGAADYARARGLWESTEGMGLNESDTEECVASFLLRNPGCSAVATTPNDELVGAVLCGHDGRRGFLHHLAVAPPYRGQGVGKALVDFCFARLAAANIPRCNVFVYEDNGEGTTFWLHNGWNEVTWKTLQKRIER